MKRFQKFIGDKEFYKATLAVAIPLMLQQLITSSVNLVDNLMVGQLGDAALGGVASVNRFYMIATAGTLGILAAAAVFIAQYYGAKDEKHMKETFRFSIVSAYAIMIPFFLMGIIMPRTIVSFFTTDAAIVQMGVEYMQLAAFTFLPMALSLAISSALRAVGEARLPLYVSAMAVLINTFLNYILIFGNFGFQAYGVQGAAVATIIARCFEAITLLIVLQKNNAAFKTKIKDLFKITLGLSKKVLLKAAPLAINEVLWGAGMATLFKFYATRGPEVISGYSISTTTSDLFFVLFGGMAAATTILISQPLGANKLDEARKHGYQLLGFSVMMSLVFAALMFGSSFIVPNFYNVTDVSKNVAMSVLRVQSIMFWIYMANTQCYFILRAGGDTKSTLFMDSGYMWLVNIPLVGILAYTTGINIILLYVIGQCTDLVKFFIAYRLVRKEKWVVNLTHIPQST